MAYVATQPYRRFNRWDPPSPRRASGAGEYRRCRRGMGDAASEAKAVQQIGSLATPAVTGIIAAHAASVAAAAGLPASSATIAGMGLSVAVPVIGAALVGATILASYLIRNSGCGQTCIVTSQWANQAEAMLKQNLAAYLALASPRPASAKTIALANFDAVWKTLQQQCGQTGTGDAGVRCISDREAGACKWRDSSGACWNWFSGYRHPIANDTDVVEDSVSSLVSSVLPGVSSSSLVPLALIAALVVVGAML